MSNAPTIEEVDEEIYGLVVKFQSAIERGDNEDAHIYEDAIKTTALRAIAEGMDYASELATLILMITERETFDRWYA